jgi:hypothetical protein
LQDAAAMASAEWGGNGDSFGAAIRFHENRDDSGLGRRRFSGIKPP